MSSLPPIVATVHSTIRMDLDSMLAGERTGWRTTDFGKLLCYPAIEAHERRVLKSASGIILVSENLTNEIPGRFRKKSSVIPNGISTTRFRPMGHTDRDRRIILVASRLTPSKGIDVALRACSILTRNGESDFRMVFSGPGLLKTYRQMASGMGLTEKNVTFIGVTPYASMPDLYSRSSVFCMPSRQESLPMSLLEAMSSGLPCVVTRVGSIPRLVRNGENGIIVRAGDATQLAEGLAYMLRHNEEAERCGRNARKTIVEGYSADIMARSHEAVYSRVIS